jgi:hypothetical protein
MRRTITAILATPTLFSGLAMLFGGPFWYASVPGASGTGPFNPHFVQDIGVAFIVAALPGQPDEVKAGHRGYDRRRPNVGL